LAGRGDAGDKFRKYHEPAGKKVEWGGVGRSGVGAKGETCENKASAPDFGGKKKKEKGYLGKELRAGLGSERIGE